MDEGVKELGGGRQGLVDNSVIPSASEGARHSGVMQFKAIRVLIALEGWAGLLSRKILRSSIQERVRDRLLGQFPGSAVVAEVSVVCMQWMEILKMARDMETMMSGSSEGVRGEFRG